MPARSLAAAPTGQLGWWVTGAVKQHLGSAANHASWLARTDGDGKLVAEQVVDLGPGHEELRVLVPMPDGSVWAAGWANSTTTNVGNAHNAALVRFDATGQVMTTILPDEALQQRWLSATVANSGFHAVGLTTTSGNSNVARVTRLSVAGASQWTYVYTPIASRAVLLSTVVL